MKAQKSITICKGHLSLDHDDNEAKLTVNCSGLLPWEAKNLNLIDATI